MKLPLLFLLLFTFTPLEAWWEEEKEPLNSSTDVQRRAEESQESAGEQIKKESSQAPITQASNRELYTTTEERELPSAALQETPSSSVSESEEKEKKRGTDFLNEESIHHKMEEVCSDFEKLNADALTVNQWFYYDGSRTPQEEKELLQEVQRLYSKWEEEHVDFLAFYQNKSQSKMSAPLSRSLKDLKEVMELTLSESQTLINMLSQGSTSRAGSFLSFEDEGEEGWSEIPPKQSSVFNASSPKKRRKRSFQNGLLSSKSKYEPGAGIETIDEESSSTLSEENSFSEEGQFLQRLRTTILDAPTGEVTHSFFDTKMHLLELEREKLETMQLLEAAEREAQRLREEINRTRQEHRRRNRWRLCFPSYPIDDEMRLRDQGCQSGIANLKEVLQQEQEKIRIQKENLGYYSQEMFKKMESKTGISKEFFKESGRAEVLLEFYREKFHQMKEVYLSRLGRGHIAVKDLEDITFEDFLPKEFLEIKEIGKSTKAESQKSSFF